MTLAGRSIVHALELLAEMPADPKLQEAKEALFRAADLIEQYVDGHAKTDPQDLAPESERAARREQPTMPDGAA